MRVCVSLYTSVSVSLLSSPHLSLSPFVSFLVAPFCLSPSLSFYITIRSVVLLFYYCCCLSFMSFSLSLSLSALFLCCRLSKVGIRMHACMGLSSPKKASSLLFQISSPTDSSCMRGECKETNSQGRWGFGFKV